MTRTTSSGALWRPLPRRLSTLRDPEMNSVAHLRPRARTCTCVPAVWPRGRLAPRPLRLLMAQLGVAQRACERALPQKKSAVLLGDAQVTGCGSTPIRHISGRPRYRMHTHCNPCGCDQSPTLATCRPTPCLPLSPEPAHNNGLEAKR